MSSTVPIQVSHRRRSHLQLIFFPFLHNLQHNHHTTHKKQQPTNPGEKKTFNYCPPFFFHLVSLLHFHFTNYSCLFNVDLKQFENRNRKCSMGSRCGWIPMVGVGGGGRVDDDDSVGGGSVMVKMREREWTFL